MVSHREILEALPQYLPVFSLTIEALLHRCTDYQIGSFTLTMTCYSARSGPDDFLTPAGAPRLTSRGACEMFKWCMDAVGDGTCDASCNVSACEFDQGDDSATEAVLGQQVRVLRPPPRSWQGRKSGRAARRPGSGTEHDERCNVLECGYDAGVRFFYRALPSQKNGTRDIPRGSPGPTRICGVISARTARLSGAFCALCAGVSVESVLRRRSCYWCSSTRTRQMRRPGAPS